MNVRGSDHFSGFDIIFNDLQQGLLQVSEEVGPMRVVVGSNKLHVIFTQWVRNNKMGPVILHAPVGQIIRIGIGIVLEPTLLNHEPASVLVGLFGRNEEFSYISGIRVKKAKKYSLFSNFLTLPW